MEDLSFKEVGHLFDLRHSKQKNMITLVPFSNGKYRKVRIRGKRGHNEEYYRQRLLYCLIETDRFPLSNMCLEMDIPTGRDTNTRADVAVFDNSHWEGKPAEWMEQHMIFAIETKCEPKVNPQETVEHAWNQLKSYLKCTERSNGIFGMVCNQETLYLFKKVGVHFKRYFGNTTSLQQADRPENVPSLYDLIHHTVHFNKPTYVHLSAVTNQDTLEMKQIFYDIKRVMDNNSAADSELGFNLIIQIIATKIFDERYNRNNLQFYITPAEKDDVYTGKYTQHFIHRFLRLFEDAKGAFDKVITLKGSTFQNNDTASIVKEMVNQLQDISFLKSTESSLYQLIFNDFAPHNKKNTNDEFLTPLAVIRFIVDLVHPRREDTVCDPTVGTADFLSIAFANSVRAHRKMIPSKIFGMDIDNEIIKLAKLNMMLNDDGNSNLVATADNAGSLGFKFSKRPGKLMNITNIKTPDEGNENYNWDDVKDNTLKLHKFDVVMTNPPFGRGRPFIADSKENREIAKRYEIYNLYRKKSSSKQLHVDKGLMFLENMVHILEPNGRFAIILSSAIASVDNYLLGRKWLINHTRIVGLFDLPINTFADTGVTTTIIVGYKPKNKEILNQNYEVYAQSINNVGYKIRANKRAKIFDPIYILDPNNSFKPKRNADGKPIKKQDFTKTLRGFNQWLKTNKSSDNAFLLKHFGGGIDD